MPTPSQYDQAVQTKIAAWLSARQAQLKITTTTTTTGGKTVDWVPIESQTTGQIASPPPDQSPSGKIDPQRRTGKVSLDEPAPGPAGHVPILRPDISRIITVNDLNNFLSKGIKKGVLKNAPAEPNPAGYFHATSAASIVTYGCSAWLNVWDPQISTSAGKDHSISQFWLQYNQAPQLLQSLEAGLTVDQSLNGDLYNHVFSFYTINNYGGNTPSNNIGGYNQTNGWVQYNKTIFPGIRINGSSVLGGAQLEIGLKFQLYEGNWWLGISAEPANPWIWMGYYPASLFNGLAKAGNSLSFGGEVYSALPNPCATQDYMGSGRKATAGWTRAAFQRLLQYQSATSTGSVSAPVTSPPGGDATMTNFNGLPETDSAAITCLKNMYTVQCFMNSGTSWDSYQYYGGAVTYSNLPPSLTSFALNGNSTRLYYLDSNGWVNELGWTGSGWEHSSLQSLQQSNHAPAAKSSPLTSFALNGNSTRLYYFDSNGYVHELGWTGSGWEYTPLGSYQGVPAVSDSPLTSFDLSGTRLYYLDINGWITELAWTGSGWSNTALHAQQQVPAVVGRNALTGFALNGDASRLYFSGKLGQLYELGWSGSGWYKSIEIT